MNSRVLQFIGLLAVAAVLIYVVAGFTGDLAYSLWSSLSSLRYSLWSLGRSLWKLLLIAVIGFVAWKVFFSRR